MIVRRRPIKTCYTLLTYRSPYYPTNIHKYVHNILDPMYNMKVMYIPNQKNREKTGGTVNMSARSAK